MTYTLLPLWGGWVLVAMRFVLGIILILHGRPKITDLKKTGENFGMMGFKPGWFWGPVAAIVEFCGGFAIILGLFMAPVALLIMGEFVVIIGWQLKRKTPFVEGWEKDLLILVIALALFFFGGGALSLDRALNVPSLF